MFSQQPSQELVQSQRPSGGELHLLVVVSALEGIQLKSSYCTREDRGGALLLDEYE